MPAPEGIPEAAAEPALWFDDEPLDPEAAASTAAAARRAPRPFRPEAEPIGVEVSRKLAVTAGLFVLVLFAVGWFLGRVQGKGEEVIHIGDRASAPFAGMGFGPPRFQCVVTSTPPGASVTVDGKDIKRRTPVTLDFATGEHVVDLTLADLGSASYTVRGANREKTALEAALTGTLAVHADAFGPPIEVSVDGTPRGTAPLDLTDLAAGPHDVEFSSARLEPWGQTVQIRVNEKSELTAHRFTTPSTGLIQIEATLVDDDGTEPLTGATVWIDGERAGATPLKIELPRGPHSIRAVYHDEDMPVQVIELPGGNQRFANFQFGTGVDRPKLTLMTSPGPMPRDRASVVSASIDGVRPGEVREMWLHVRTPEGNWRRYPMSMMPAADGVVGSVVFPPALLDASGRAPFYVSALSMLGDEYYTELLNGRKRS